MTDFFAWLPFGVLGVAIMIFLAIVRLPAELEPAAGVVEPEASFDVGAVRLAAVIHSDEGLVIDGLVDRLSPLGSVGSPMTLVVSEVGLDEATFRLLLRWLDSDAVVELEVPLDAMPQRVVDLRSGADEMRLAIVGLSS